MYKKIGFILIVIVLIAILAVVGQSDKDKLSEDEQSAFEMVKSYYTASGKLDVKTAMDAVFPESRARTLEAYDGDIDKYAQFVKETEEAEPEDIEVKYISIDREKYINPSNFDAEVKALEEIFGIDESKVSKILTITVLLSYKGDSKTESEQKSVDVCKYDGKWYISPTRVSEEDEADSEEESDEENPYQYEEYDPTAMTVSEILEKAIEKVEKRIENSKTIGIIKGVPNEDERAKSSKEIQYISIFDNDLFVAQGNGFYSSMCILGLSDDYYTIYKGEFSISDGNLKLKLTATANSGEEIGRAEKIIKKEVSSSKTTNGDTISFTE